MRRFPMVYQPKPIRALFLFGLWLATSAFPAGSEPVLGVEIIPEPLPFYDPSRNLLRVPGDGEALFGPMRVLLSRYRYWKEDGHLDVVIQLQVPEGVTLSGSRLDVEIFDAEGETFSTFSIAPPDRQFIFYPRLPESLLGSGTIRLTFVAGDEILAEAHEAFRVETFGSHEEREGRVRLEVANDAQVVQNHVPVTVGVPFPRGVIHDTKHLRLVDAEGGELPLQVRETARWSKFGSLKWVLCDFTVDLDGGPRVFYLEYGPKVERADPEPLHVESSEGFPIIDAGQLRFDDGLWFDAGGRGEWVKVLDEAALTGAFVEHEDGRLYRMPPKAPFEIEEVGPEKVVLRREGWFQEQAGEREFCQYLVRYVIHRGSPLVRIFYTWIFTGDGNHDRIANMGWEWNGANELEPGGFLTAFGGGAEWVKGDYLLQYDYDDFEVVDGERVREFAGGRAPGVAFMEGHGVRLFFGAKDFWRNYPSELEFRDDALWFHNWPRHNRPGSSSYDTEALDESEWRLNVLQARFAHEGDVLDFRLPDELAEDPIWGEATGHGRAPQERHWDQGAPESANAQGISRTEEMWIYLVPDDSAGSEEAVRFLQALDAEQVRACAGRISESCKKSWTTN